MAKHVTLKCKLVMTESIESLNQISSFIYVVACRMRRTKGFET